MSVFRAINLLVLFVLEMCMLAALGYWGLTAVQGWPRYALALAVIGLVAVGWGTFLAPKATRPLAPTLTFVLKTALLGLSAALLALAGRPSLAAGFALAIAINALLLWFNEPVRTERKLL